MNNMAGKRQDLTGLIFSELTVVQYSHTNDKRQAVWECLCSCGKTVYVRSGDLKNGHTKACGHLIGSNRKNGNDAAIAISKLYSRYKYGAKRRGYSFDLSLVVFQKITSQKCIYCGIEPKQESKHNGSTYYYNGIDRADNTKGYTVDNSVACCYTCNKAKSVMTESEWIAWVSRLKLEELKISAEAYFPPNTTIEVVLVDKSTGDSIVFSTFTTEE